MSENNFTFGFYTSNLYGAPTNIPKRIGAFKAYEIEFENLEYLR